MFFQKKKQKTQIKPSADGIYSYRDLNRVQEKTMTSEPTKMAVMAMKFKLKFQTLDLSAKKLSENVKNKIKKEFAGIKSNPKFKNFSEKTKTFLIDHFHLLTKSSAENHLRIQKCKKIKEGEACNLEFNSYSELKRYQKKVRILTYSTSSSLSLVLITSLVLQLLMPALPTRGATFYFDQTGWKSTPNPSAEGVHPGDQSSFTDYESKDQYIEIQNPGSDSSVILGTAQSSESKTQTSSTDFSVGANNGTGVGGSSDSAYVFPCEFDHGGSVWEPTNGDTWDLDATASIAVAGTHCNISNFTIASGKTVSVKAYDGTNYGVLRIYATDSTIAGTLDASGKGYVAKQGPGAGGVNAYDAASSHGGLGGNNNNNNSIYGSFSEPSTMGSGGFSEGGGGIINISIANIFSLSGSVNATGKVAAGYGSSGGSIKINTSILTGVGNINANGANGSGSSYGTPYKGGGGGRVAIYYQAKTSYSGQVTSFGGLSGTGTSVGAGGAGTVFQKATSQTYGDLIINNNNVNSALTPLNAVAQSLQLDNLNISKYAKAINIANINATNLNVTANGTLTNTGNTAVVNIDVSTGGVLNSSGNITASASFNAQSGTSYALTAGTVSSGTGVITAPNFPSALVDLTLTNFTLQLSTLTLSGNLTVGTGSNITHPKGNTAGLTITAANVDVQSGGNIDVSGKGYDVGSGPGFSGFNGGTHGGLGGNSNASVYGSITNPDMLGSSSSNRSGGGLINISVVNNFSLNGSINANGDAGTYYDGSAGGSIKITSNVLSGTGPINAGGSSGNGVNFGTPYDGGGGGRIAIYYQTKTAYSGQVTSFGGLGGAGTSVRAGSAGTVFQKKSSQTYGDLTVDNNNVDSINTPLFPTAQSVQYDSLTVTRYAKVTNVIDVIAGNLIIDNNASLTVSGNVTASNSINGFSSGTATLTSGTINAGSSTGGGIISFPSAITNLTLNSFTIQTVSMSVSGDIVAATGSIITHPQGNIAGIVITAANVDIQSGAKINVNYKGYTNENAPGGISPISPNQLGSSGYSGTNGGGYVRMIVSGLLTLNGGIESNGASQGTNYRNAGSGGSIWISAGNIATSSGLISANGGTTSWGAPGGSGGHIAFDGYAEFGLPMINISANGGATWSAGPQGTIYGNGSPLALNNQQLQQFAISDPIQNLEVQKNQSNLIAEIFSFVFGIQKARAATADFTSSTIDTNFGIDKAFITFTTLTFSADSGISFQVATNNDNATWNFVGPDGSAGTFYTTSGQEINSVHDNNRYLKYKAYFTYTTNEPHFNDITFNYTADTYQTNQTLVSSWYNANDSANFFTGVVWEENENLPTGTGVKFQVQSAANNENGTPGDLTDDIPAAITGFVGPDGTAGTYFTNADATCTKNSQTVSCNIPNNIVGDGTDDQWIKYKLILDSAGSFTPQIDRVKLQYVVNFTPQVSNVSADQDTNGKINLTYDLADGDNEIFSVSFAANVGVTLQENPLTLSDTSIELAGNYANLPTGVQTIQINREQITCQSRTGATLNSCTRAQNNSRAFQHNQGDIVWFVANPASTTGTGSGLSAGTGKVGTWDIKEDLLGIYVPTATIRVVANDGTVANQVSEATNAVSTPFVLDTKDPTNVSINVDHRSDKETVTIKKSGTIDDSTYKLYLSTSGTFTEQDEIPLPENLTYPYVYDYESKLSDIADSGTVWLRIKDEKGNTNDYNISNQIKTVIPPKPQRLLFYDISNLTADPPDYRELIAWTELSFPSFASYNVMRSQDGESFEVLPDGEIANSTLNYYPNKDLTEGTRYYYKAFTKDTEGNYSAYSNTVDDIPDGNGSSDSNPPAISNIQIPETEITTTSATITWDTDELSDSTVGFALDDQSEPQYLPQFGNASLVNNHTIRITGLIPDKTYAIRITSRDALNNPRSLDKLNNDGFDPSLFKFTTKEGPAILSFTFNQISNNEVSLSWNTTTDADSTIYYSDTLDSNGDLLMTEDDTQTPDIDEGKDSGTSHSAEMVKRHLQTITDLTKGKKYYFYLTSQDETGNIATDDNAGLLYEFTTDSDDTNPIITIDQYQPTIKSNTQAVVMWSTDEQATTLLEYKKKTQSWDDAIEVEPTPGVLDKSHYVIISSLTPETNYDYRVTSADINGNKTTETKNNQNNNLEFRTEPDPDMNHPPLAEIKFSDNNPTLLTDTDAVISFTTDQIANCMLNSWEADVPEIINVPIQEEETSYNLNHSLHLSKLKFLTRYGYEVFCHDNIKDDEGNYVNISSEKQEFTTKEKLYTESGAGALLDKVAPVINNVSVASVDGESATITWETNEKGSSSVRYGIDSNYGVTFGDDLINSSSENYVTSHSVTITGLIPATKYLFKATSLDASGNIAESSESSFTTASPSSLTSIKAQSLNLGEATITWSTSSETTSTVEYGLTSSYGEKKESNTLTKDHTIQLSSLNQGATYHYRVKGKDKDGKLYASSDQTFEPKSPPKIENISINDITEHEAKVSFTTNVPTTATVNFSNISDPQDNGAQSDTEMATKHTIQLKNLSQGTTFKIQISARDEQATESTIDAKDITTGKDENPPKIDMVKTDLALTQNDKVQAIISWKTDEQATTTVTYKEGRNGEQKEFKVSDNLTTNHIAVITSFKPGIVYYFNARSTDASGNKGSSTDFALLTPKKRQNIIQIIIGNFTDIFGWARM